MTFWEVGTIKQDWRTGLCDPGTKKHPQTPYEPAQEMPFKWIWGITANYPRRADRRNIRSFRSRHASSLSGSTTLGKKKKIYATTRRKSQESEVLIVLLFCLFSKKKKKKTLRSGGVVRQKLIFIMDFSSTIFIIIIIIISCWQHGYPWPSLATPPYRSSP